MRLVPLSGEQGGILCAAGTVLVAKGERGYLLGRQRVMQVDGRGGVCIAASPAVCSAAAGGGSRLLGLGVRSTAARSVGLGSSSYSNIHRPVGGRRVEGWGIGGRAKGVICSRKLKRLIGSTVEPDPESFLWDAAEPGGS